jgi:hypothetical protein
MRHNHVRTEDTEAVIKGLQEQARQAKLQSKVSSFHYFDQGT